MCSSSVTAQCNKEKAGSCSLTKLTRLNIHNTKSLLIKTHNRGLQLRQNIAANVSLKGVCVCVWVSSEEREGATEFYPQALINSCIKRFHPYGHRQRLKTSRHTCSQCTCMCVKRHTHINKHTHAHTKTRIRDNLSVSGASRSFSREWPLKLLEWHIKNQKP